MASTLFQDSSSVALYWCREDRVDSTQLSRCRALLSAEEQAQADRFVYDIHRQQYTVAHGMVRSVLAQTLDRAPQDLTFDIGEKGRPELSDRALRFNLSHTQGMVIIGLTHTHDLGVDVEFAQRRSQTTQIADRFFSPLEVAALNALPEAEQRERFFAYWTLKEAYIKGRGLGLSIPLDQFSFILEGNKASLYCAPALGDRGDDWKFARLWPTPAHPVAVALRAPSLTVTATEFVP